jgi:hypothetical protein
MSGTANNRLLSKVLAFVLNGNPSVSVLDYTDRKKFKDLWLHGLRDKKPTIDEKLLDWTDKGAVVLLVGEAPPGEILGFKEMPECLKGLNFRDHLTATSWAAAWRIRFPEAKARVIVIEPTTRSDPSTIARSLGILFGARGADGAPLVPGVSLLRAPTLEKLSSQLDLNAKGDCQPSKAVQGMVKTTIWSALTADREDHHSISNVLGALLMGSEVGDGLLDKDAPWAADYLLALVQACGVKGHREQHAPRENGDRQCWLSNELRAEIGAAVLVDDMADIWEDFLRGALGFDANEEFRGENRTFLDSFVSTKDALFDETMLGLPGRLTEALKDNRRRLTAADLIPGKHRFESEFVLFLDLRLFTANDTQTADEFHKRLVAFGKQLLAQKPRKLPWLDAHRYIDLECELDGEKIAGHPRETLLPRILSLLDPTLPIVIFSSTHRTELIGPFRDYSNIITTFRKPILTGLTRSWDEVAKELRSDFCEALQEAATIRRVRRDLARLTITESGAPPAEAAKGNRRIIEIYIDESGDPFNKRDPGFAVGGIMLQHENEEAQQVFHHTINQYPKKWGVSDYAPDRIRADEVATKLPGIAFYPKRPARGGPEEEEGLALVSSALNSRSRIAAFALIEPDLLRFQPDTQLDSGILFDRNSLDNVYHLLLRTNLEMLLFQHPWIDLTHDSVHVNVATRDQPLRHDRTRRIWEQAYGLKFKERRGAWCYTSLGRDSVYRLTCELLRSRDVHKDRPDIVTARGVTLNDYEEIVGNWRERGQTPRLNSQLYDPSRLDPKQIHYVADWTIRMALYRNKDLPIRVKPWFNAGYIQPLNEEFLALLDACRLSSAAKSIQRLSRIGLSAENSVRTELRAEKYLRQTASTWPGLLSGDDLRALFSETKTRVTAIRPPKLSRTSPAPERVVLAVPKVETPLPKAQPASVADHVAKTAPVTNQEAPPIRWRVLIEAPEGCDRPSFQSALQSTDGIPRPKAMRVFESDQKAEFILDLASADEVRRLVAAPITISGALVTAVDVTLPRSHRIVPPLRACSSVTKAAQNAQTDSK